MRYEKATAERVRFDERVNFMTLSPGRYDCRGVSLFGPCPSLDASQCPEYGGNYAVCPEVYVSGEFQTDIHYPCPVFK